MKLLFDQNLSPRLVVEFSETYPGSAHVREFGLQTASDDEVWEFAKSRGFTIASKDADFHQRSFLYGPPPKVIWLRVGNSTTQQVIDSLRRQAIRLESFELSEQAAFLVID